jgi:hypothetical protein
MVTDLDDPRIDLVELGESLGEDLPAALDALRAFYADIDARVARTTAELNLPCRAGCDACCHESVFLTPLEFLAAWTWAEAHVPAAVRSAIAQRGVALAHEHAGLLAALQEPPQQGDTDHWRVAQSLRFRCPFLGSEGNCLIYPARELYARLFGASFWGSAIGDGHGIYGCDLVGKHLAGREVTLVHVRTAAMALNQLPLTAIRRPYPYYLALFFEE